MSSSSPSPSPQDALKTVFSHDVSATAADDKKALHSNYEDNHPDTSRSAGPFVNQRLPVRWLPIPLIITSVATGMLDVATFADFFAFASNQTGSCIIIFIGAFHEAPNASALLSGVSLGSFCAFAFLFGQLTHHLPRNGPRTRWWLSACGLLQALLVLVAGILIQTGTWQSEGNEADAARILALLAGSGGVQVVNAKMSSVSEVPTAIVTSAWAELLSDPNIFSPHLLTAAVRSRNLRALHIGGLMAGAALGAVIRKYAGSGPVIFTAAGIKILTTFIYFFLPGEVESIRAN
ncbi:hypothetical protein OC834_005678 [Tilletia horrida]|nr:hypothetical protein OC834_005678 [Tilletia horrida]